VHLQEAYEKYGYKQGDFPVAERLCKEVISLPIHTEMNGEVQEYIILNVKNFFNENRK
jgi:dTDP-4-amino-4,6-dideoxygalactose transaminase